jgi:hypothetical protein
LDKCLDKCIDRPASAPTFTLMLSEGL